MFMTHNSQEQRECHATQGHTRMHQGHLGGRRGKQGQESFFFFLWPHWTVCEILVHWPGMEPTPTAVGVQSLNRWTREVFIVVFMGRNGWDRVSRLVWILWAGWARRVSLVSWPQVTRAGGQRPRVWEPSEGGDWVVGSGSVAFDKHTGGQAVSCL